MRSGLKLPPHMLGNVHGAQRHHRFGFRGDWLYFQDDDGLFRVRGWPQLDAEYRDASAGWHKVDLAKRDQLINQFWYGQRPPDDLIEHHLLVPRDNTFQDVGTGQMFMPWIVPSEGRRHAYGCFHWRQFLATLPDGLGKHATRLRCDFLSALNLFQEVPAAMDLTRHNPMLATALARHWEFPAVGQVDWPAVHQQVRHRRRAIMGWLGYPATDAMANNLERIWIDGTNVAEAIQRSVAIMNDPVFGPALQHLPLVDQAVVDCLANPLTRQWLEPRRLKEIGPRRLCEHVGFLFQPINILLGAGVIDLDAARQLSWCKPDRRSAKWMLPYLKPHPLPAAPAPTASGIERLQSLAEQIREGEEMAQCIGSMPYVLRAACGNVAVYRVTLPVRATVALSSQDQGCWQIEDVRGPHNVAIAPAHLAQIASAFPPEVHSGRWI